MQALREAPPTRSHCACKPGPAPDAGRLVVQPELQLDGSHSGGRRQVAAAGGTSVAGRAFTQAKVDCGSPSPFSTAGGLKEGRRGRTTRGECARCRIGGAGLCKSPGRTGRV